MTERNDCVMKKWHIISVASALAVAMVVISGVLVYKYYLTPRYIEPIVDEIGEYVKKDEVIDSLYNEAEKLYDNGVLEGETYSNFVRAYNEYKRNDVEYAKQVIEEHESEDTLDTQKNSVSTKYASYKVGVETIQINDGEAKGKADVSYSDERTSDRIKAEDVVKAEKIIKDAENSEPTPTPDVVKSAYEKLRARMTSEEFATFTTIMKQLDIETLKQFTSDKEGLKNYLHSRLTDEEYSAIVNLGYKYVNVFIEKNN